MSQRRCNENGYSNERGFWSERTMWRHAAKLPRFRISLGLTSPSPMLERALQSAMSTIGVEDVRGMIDWMKEASEVDLSFPIIFSSTGDLMDGFHRLVKAHMRNEPWIEAVQFEVDPPPTIKARHHGLQSPSVLPQKPAQSRLREAREEHGSQVRR